MKQLQDKFFRITHRCSSTFSCLAVEILYVLQRFLCL